MDEQDEDIIFEYYNIDINLLALHVLLEGFYRGQNTFTLKDFLKGNYWKIDEIADEITDTQDYGSVEDLVLHQVIRMINDLGIGKVKRVSLTTLYGLTETVVKEALEEKEATDEKMHYYTSVIDEIVNLRKLKDAQLEQRLQSGMSYKDMANRVDFTEEDFGRHLQYISAISAPFIELEIEFDDEKAHEVNKAIDDYIFSFYQDDYVEKKPTYREKRYYFSKQIENFFTYIKSLPLIEGHVNIPFSVLSEQGFEAIKVLSYLEREKRIKVHNWNDAELWHVKFHKTPITLASLLGESATKEPEGAKKEQEIKLSLSFTRKTGVMILADKEGKKYTVKVQGQVQREVIGVIFGDAKNTYGQWSLYDISEILGGADVNETAVKNAIYQFNRKVKLAIPQVGDIFELTKHSAQLNPKYVNQN